MINVFLFPGGFGKPDVVVPVVGIRLSEITGDNLVVKLSFYIYQRGYLYMGIYTGTPVPISVNNPTGLYPHKS
jgi:hypothetical protein